MINLLILDDDALYCSEFGDYLKTKECIKNVFTATSPADSDVILSNNDIDLILLDIGMPTEDGLTYLERLNNSSKGRPNVIFISNMKNEFIINRAFSLGCSYYLCKPINYDYVYNIIVTLFNTDIQSNVDNPIHDLFNSCHISTDSIGFRYMCQGSELLSSLPSSMISTIEGLSNVLSLKNNQNNSYIKWHLYKLLNRMSSNKVLLDALKESEDISPYNVLYSLIIDFKDKVSSL